MTPDRQSSELQSLVAGIPTVAIDNAETLLQQVYTGNSGAREALILASIPAALALVNTFSQSGPKGRLDSENLEFVAVDAIIATIDTPPDYLTREMSFGERLVEEVNYALMHVSQNPRPDLEERRITQALTASADRQQEAALEELDAIGELEPNLSLRELILVMVTANTRRQLEMGREMDSSFAHICSSDLYPYKNLLRKLSITKEPLTAIEQQQFKISCVKAQLRRIQTNDNAILAVSAELPLEQRAILSLHYLRNMELKDIADRFYDGNLRAVQSLYYSALTILSNSYTMQQTIKQTLASFGIPEQ